MNKKMNKNGGVSISVVLFVIALLGLVTYSLYTFNSQKGDFEKRTGNILFLNDLYEQELRVRIFIDSAISDVIREPGDKNLTVNEMREKVINRLRLIDETGDKEIITPINQAIKQIGEESFVLSYEQGVVRIKLRITLEGSLVEEDAEVAMAKHEFNIEKSYGVDK